MTTVFVVPVVELNIVDRIGRVPVVVIGTFGLAAVTFLFGLSTTFQSLLITRFLSSSCCSYSSFRISNSLNVAGLFCGIIGALHSIVGELSDTSNASTAFPLYDICSALGFIVGCAHFSLFDLRCLILLLRPVIGGAFIDPAERFPTLFGIQLFQDHPYLLSCSLTALISLGASALAAFYLREVSSLSQVPSAPPNPQPRPTAGVQLTHPELWMRRSAPSRKSP
jgi:MFS family permease